jgi:hypothetical protein
LEAVRPTFGLLKAIENILKVGSLSFGPEKDQKRIDR